MSSVFMFYKFSLLGVKVVDYTLCTLALLRYTSTVYTYCLFTRYPTYSSTNQGRKRLQKAIRGIDMSMDLFMSVARTRLNLRICVALPQLLLILYVESLLYKKQPWQSSSLKAKHIWNSTGNKPRTRCFRRATA